MVVGSPRICIIIIGMFNSAAVSSACGRVSARTSFQMCAPAATAARITSGCEVSIEIMTSCCASACTTGMTLRISSSTSTTDAPGRVDSPPTSITVAPSATICNARATAASWELCKPPSLKESGVTFRIPITCGWDKSKRKRPQLRTRFGKGISCINTLLKQSLLV